MRRTVLVLSATAAAIAVSVSGFSRQGAPPAPASFRALSLPSPTFPGVVKDMQDPHRAMALLDTAVAARGEDAPIEAAVLRAHLLSAAGRAQESAAAWDAIAGSDSSLLLFGRRSAIGVLLAAHDVEAARSRIEAVSSSADPGSRLSMAESDLLWLSLADAYQSSKRIEQAAQIYRDVSGRHRGNAAADRAGLGLAACEEAAGRFESALQLWHGATLVWRSADTYAAARAGERRVAARLEREPLPLDEEQHFDIAERLAAQSHYDDAVALLEEGKRRRLITDDERVEAALVDTLYRGRRNDEAMSRADRFLARFAGSRRASAVRLTQLRLDIRTGKVASARKRLAALNAAPETPADVRRAGANLIAAQLTATGNPREALVLYRGLIAGSRARADRYDFSWRAGIAATRARNPRAALAFFAQARRLAPARTVPRSSIYWHGVALSQTGSAEQATRLWTQLIDDHAYDYYGLRAAERLRRQAESGPGPEALKFPDLELSAAAQSAPELRAAITLARAGLDDDAASLLRRLVGRLPGDRALGLMAARAAYSVQDYAGAWSLVATRFSMFFAHPAAGVPEDLWRMAFPRAYWPEVEAAASKAGVDPLLMLALMRRESRFVVAARSRTGAMGLFQIMPYTARELVPASEEPPSGEELLAAPASAELAARLVKRIHTEFGNQIAPVVAAYNAGEDRVRDWWKSADGLPEDLFVDSIPYAETRQYVREVLSNYATYRRLYR